MNQSWVEIRQRVALGVEPVDAVLGTRIVRSIHVELEGLRGPVAIGRHESGRHALLNPETLGESVDLRLYDRRRGVVPRRFRVPMPDSAERRVALRTRRLVLFPGVAWDLGGGATALRGQVRLDDEPVRWAWLEGRLPDDDVVVIRTRADDRGEYLLVLDVDTVELAQLTSSIELDLRVYGPSTAVAPSSDEVDPLWDLPLETLALPGAADPIAAGTPSLPADLPDDWATLGEARVTLEVGRCVSDQELLFF